MIYLSLEIDESVPDEQIQIRHFDLAKWHWMGDVIHIYNFANLDIYNNKKLVVICNSDTVVQLRAMLGGSFGLVKHFPIPVPKGIQIEQA